MKATMLSIFCGPCRRSRLFAYLAGAVLSASGTQLSPLLAQDTAFIYQGRLTDGTNAADGIFDLQFAICDSPSGPNVLAAVTNTSVRITNGLFTVTLDFGAAVFDGNARWLETGVRTHGSIAPHVTLVPRQPLSPTPYAIHAASARLFDGKGTNVFAPATGSAEYVAKRGDTMTGVLSIQGGESWTTDSWLVRLNSGLSSSWRSEADIGTYLGLGMASTGWFFIKSDSSGSAATPEYPVVIRETGNVGIGTTEPLGKLSISPHPAVGYHFTASSSPGGYQTTFNMTETGLHIGHNSPFRNLTLQTFALDRMTIGGDGNVGVGTTTPSTKLQIIGPNAVVESGWKSEFLSGYAGNYLSQRIGFGYDASGANTYGAAIMTEGTTRLWAGNDGNVGIGTTSPNLAGTAPRRYLTILGGGSAYYDSGALELANPRVPAHGDVAGEIRFLATGNNGDMRVGFISTVLAGDGGPNGFGSAMRFFTKQDNSLTQNTSLYLDENGNVGIGTTSPQAKLDVAGAVEATSLQVNGATTTGVLTITGGADLAEPFQVSGRDIAKGAVLVIDPQHPGQLKQSDRAYDKRVAGIVSGANGIQPGITLHQEGALEGSHHIALSGRVYALADATYGAITPGDLLTTSDTPGHAMKVTDDSRAHGAILGKAMTGLDEGTGLVLVLVTLH